MDRHRALAFKVLKHLPGVLLLVLLLAATTLLAVAPVPGYDEVRAQEEPRIEEIEPNEGHCGDEIDLTLTVSGVDFFKSKPNVVIPDGVNTIYTEVIGPIELEVKIFITEGASPGPRPVVVFAPEFGEVIREQGFTVTCPAAEPKRRPDLVLIDLGWEGIEEAHVLLIAARVGNAGNVQAPGTIMLAMSQAAEWSGETSVPELDSDNSVEVLINLEIPDELRGRDHRFSICVDPWDEITEWSEDNNCQDIEVWIPGIDEIPPQAPGPDEDETTLLLLIVIGVIVVVTGVTITIRRSIKVRRRKEWQEKAEEEEPPETCQPCTFYCRKIEIELEPALRKITCLNLSAYDPVSSEQIKEMQVEGEIVDGLNRAVTTRRQRQNPEKVQSLVAPVSSTLLQQIKEWLLTEPAPRDVSIVGHLEGGKVTFQFILYHCKRMGNVNIWEEEDKWKASVEDKRDEPVGILRNLDPTKPEIPKQLSSGLIRLLMQFIEKI